MTDNKKTIEKVKFCYMRTTYDVDVKDEDKLETIFTRFVKMLNENYIPEEFDFYYNKKKLDYDSKKLKDIIDSGINDITIIPERKIRIIKCPKCIFNDCIINLDDYRIVFYGCCKNNHIIYNLLGEYDNSQKVNFSNINCKVCKETMENENQDFYKCMDCSKSDKHACYLCNRHISEGIHATHKKKRYDDKHYYCEEHFEKFIEYCFKCEKNLCNKCLQHHRETRGHIVRSYESLAPNLNEIKGNLKVIKEYIDQLKTKIEDIKEDLDGALKMYENYYKIANDITVKYALYNKELKNYRILRSFLNLKKSNSKIKKALEELVKGEEGKEEDLINKISKLINIYKTDRAIYNNDIEHKKFDVKHSEEDLREWEDENAINGTTIQNTPQITRQTMRNANNRNNH